MVRPFQTAGDSDFDNRHTVQLFGADIEQSQNRGRDIILEPIFYLKLNLVDIFHTDNST